MTTDDNLHCQVQKYEYLLKKFSNHIQNLTYALECEKEWRFHEFKKVEKSLRYFEKKLKFEQKLIKYQLYEKDSEITRLNRENSLLQEIHDDNKQNLYIQKYCPVCRKKLNFLDHQSVSNNSNDSELLLTLQVNENDNDDNNDNNPIYPRHESIQTTENEIKIDIPPSVPEDVLYNESIKKENTMTLHTNNNMVNTDDWYAASVSDMDDSDETLYQPYTCNVINPVLECMNQILLQQSMDNIMATPERKHEILIDKPIKEDVNHQYSQSDYECIFDNEYEIIGYKMCSLDSKSGSLHEKSIKNKIPPALPPKPANLMKIKHVLKVTNDKYIPLVNDNNNNRRQESEPDYCSILDINEQQVHTPIIANDHKIAYATSLIDNEDCETDIMTTDELFSDVPKLPNVAAILSPKKVIGQFLTQCNTTTTSVLPTTKSINENIVDCIKEMNTSSLKKTFEEKMQIHSEFDWYNLDAEYGKDSKFNLAVQNRKGMLQRSTVNQYKEQHTNYILDAGIEYNLDSIEFLNQGDSGG